MARLEEQLFIIALFLIAGYIFCLPSADDSVRLRRFGQPNYLNPRIHRRTRSIRIIPLETNFQFREIMDAVMHPEQVFKPLEASSSKPMVPSGHQVVETVIPYTQLTQLISPISESLWSPRVQESEDRVQPVQQPSLFQSNQGHFQSDMVQVLRDGLMFTKHLKDTVRDNDNTMDLIYEMDAETLQHGIQFYKGAEQLLNPSKFFEGIQSEIAEFYRSPRTQSEAVGFQNNIQERIVQFSDMIATFGGHHGAASTAHLQHPSHQHPVQQHPVHHPTHQQPVHQHSVHHSSNQQPFQHPSHQRPVQHPSHQHPVQHLSHQQPVQHPSNQHPVLHLSHQQPVQHPSHQQPFHHPSLELFSAEESLHQHHHPSFPQLVQSLVYEPSTATKPTEQTLVLKASETSTRRFKPMFFNSKKSLQEQRKQSFSPTVQTLSYSPYSPDYMSIIETMTNQHGTEVFGSTGSLYSMEPKQPVAPYREDLMSIVKSTDMESVGSRIAKKEEVVDFFIDSLIDNGDYSNSRGYQKDYGSILEKFVEELLPEPSRPISESAIASQGKIGYNTEAPTVIPVRGSVSSQSENAVQYYSQSDEFKNYNDKKAGFIINDFLDELLPEEPTPSSKPASTPVFLSHGRSRYKTQTPIVIPLRGKGSDKHFDDTQYYSQPGDHKNYNGIQYEENSFNFQNEVVPQSFGSFPTFADTQQPPYVPVPQQYQGQVDLAVTEHDSVLSILDSFLDNIIPVSKHSDVDMMDKMKNQLMETVTAELKSQGSSHNHLILLQPHGDTSSAEEYSKVVQQNVLDFNDEKITVTGDLLDNMFPDAVTASESTARPHQVSMVKENMETFIFLPVKDMSTLHPGRVEDQPRVTPTSKPFAERPRVSSLPKSSPPNAPSLFEPKVSQPRAGANNRFNVIVINPFKGKHGELFRQLELEQRTSLTESSTATSFTPTATTPFTTITSPTTTTFTTITTTTTVTTTTTKSTTIITTTTSETTTTTTSTSAPTTYSTTTIYSSLITPTTAYTTSSSPLTTTTTVKPNRFSLFNHRVNNLGTPKNRYVPKLSSLQQDTSGTVLDHEIEQDARTNQPYSAKQDVVNGYDGRKDQDISPYPSRPDEYLVVTLRPSENVEPTPLKTSPAVEEATFRLETEDIPTKDTYDYDETFQAEDYSTEPNEGRYKEYNETPTVDDNTSEGTATITTLVTGLDDLVVDSTAGHGIFSTANRSSSNILGFTTTTTTKAIVTAELTTATESIDHDEHLEPLTSTTVAQGFTSAPETSTAALEDYDEGASHDYDYNTNYDEYVYTPVTEASLDTEDETADIVDAADTTLDTSDAGIYTHDSVVLSPGTDVITHHTVVHTPDTVYEIVHNQDTIDTVEVVHTHDEIVHAHDADQADQSPGTFESDIGDTSYDYGDSNYNDDSISDDDYIAPVAVDNPVESSAQLLEASKLLLKKLAMLTMGDKTLAAFPNLLDQIFSQLDLVEVTTSPATTTTTTPTTTKAATRAKNFKHKKLSDFYSKTSTDVEGSTADVDYDEGRPRTDLLSSLRSQIITTALEDRNILAKANNVQRYYPGRKIASKGLKSYYGTTESAVLQEKKLQEELAEELNASLRDQLAALKNKVEGEYARKSAYQDELVNSVKQQLQLFTSALENKSSNSHRKKPANIDEKPAKVEDTAGSDVEEDLAARLEQQLRSFYSFG